MSAQINLYHPRFLKQRDRISLTNLTLALAATYTLLALVGGWARQEAAERSAAAAAAEAQLKAAQAQVIAATTAATNRRPSPQLQAEVDHAEAVLRRRTSIARWLESGALGSSGGFADYLRGFARQVPPGLWLTSFTVGAGGNDMEIRGSALNPAALPDYLRRLGSEKVFQGRNFATLTMNRATPAANASAAGQNAVPPAPTSGPQPIDFVLLPKLSATPAAKP